MYSGEDKKREKNPRENANWLSILLFIFAFKTIRKGARKELREDDVYEIMNSYQSQKLGDRMESLWKKETKKSRPFLLRPIFIMFGLEYSILGVSSWIAEVAIRIMEPLLTGKVVSYFDPGTKLSREDALKYTAALVACIYIYKIYDATYYFMQKQINLKARIACCSLMYRKCLRLNMYSSPQYAAGQAVTLMTKDVTFFDGASDAGHVIISGIIQVIITTYIMYQAIGVAVLIGSSVIFFMLPFDVFLGMRISTLRLRTAAKTDQRVRVTQEILTAMRIIKMYTWEPFFSKCVSIFRKKEIQKLRSLLYTRALGLSIGQLSSRVAFYICVMTYIALGNHITAEKAFVVTGCFGALNQALSEFMPQGISRIAELKASIERITNFLLLEEVPETETKECGEEKLAGVLIKNAAVKSDKGVEVVKDVSLELKQGLTVVTGPTGAGKSTLLKLVLGDVKKSEGTVEVFGKVSYASQEPWLFPGTVKQNIIFGELFDQDRYETIIKVCELNKDLDAFPNGDRTCLTDQGLNLSRGQKTRINLARAVYKKADIYLLDDCFSAVDAQVGKHIFFECLKGFLKDKLCVLVTHQFQLFQEVDNIVILSHGGIKFQGNYNNFKKWDDEDLKRALVKNESEYEHTSYDNVAKEEIANEMDTSGEDTNLLSTVDKSKNIYEETNKEGGVSKHVYFTYFKSGGGLKMAFVVIFFCVVAQVAASWSDYFVSFWVDMEQEMSGFRFNGTTNSPEFKKLEENYDNVMALYSCVIFAATVFTLLKAFSFFMFSSKASTNIHKSVFESVLHAKMIFFDANLSGNVLNRFSRDLSVVDEEMPYVIFGCMDALISLFGVLFVVSSINLFFIIPSIVLTIILYFARRFYRPSGRSIRRLEGATRSPVIGHLTATLEGLTTIRASQAQKILTREFDRHQDLYNSVSYMRLSVTHAFGFYLTMTGSIYISVIVLTFLFVKTETLAGLVGLAITQSMSLSGVLQWGVRQWVELEVQMTSVERVLEYNKIEPEETSGGKLEKWPKDGRIAYRNVNLRYSPASERVLKDIHFEIEPRQKIGVVGRTGAGKTSIISTLFRLYEFKGTINIDNVDVNSVAVELLRSKISIIPQDPVLFSGTIRSNLDPYGEYADKELWDGLEEVEMKKFVGDLNMNILEGGSNFSNGQKQLLCLARAIIRKNPILVLDEATANVDPQTDSLIQRTIKRLFSDRTVITIAHRLSTIMDSDRVLVMDSGNAVEYDSPKILLENRNGTFYKMVRDAGLLRI